MQKLIFLFISLVFTVSGYYPQSKDRSFITDSLDAYVEEALKKWNIPGTAVCIVKDGEAVLMKGYGVRKAGTNNKVDENTLFMIGSNTKAFTGTALALLEYDGKLSLDDKVQKYLPDFTMKDPWVAKELNLTDIVSHRMGMETFQGDFMYWTSDLTMDEVIQKFGKLTPLYDFRTKWGYTNAGYAIAGKIIEKVNGKSWSEFIRERIFVPLNMNRTIALSEELLNADNVAVPHTIIEGNTIPIAIPDIDNLAPAGSISSSVKDMSRWLIAQLNKGRHDEEDAIPVTVINKTRNPVSIIGRTNHPFNKQHYELYALGWELQDYEGKELIQHTGGVNGFVTSVTLVPEANLGVVVLTNTDQNGLFLALKWEIIDAYLNLPFRDYSSYYYERFEKGMKREEKRIHELKDSVKLDLKPVLPLDAFTGRYKNDIYGFTDIKMNNNRLEMNFEHHKNLKAELESLGGNRFLCSFNDPIYGTRIVQFTTENRNVRKFIFNVDPFIEFTTYEFVKQ